MKASLLYEIGGQAFQDGLQIQQLIEVMQCQNIGRINARMSDAGAARAGIVVRNALIGRIVLMVAGAYAPARRGDRHLRCAFDLLKDKDLRALAENHGDAANISQAEDLWLARNADARLRIIKHFRDKHTAHAGEPTPGVPKPSYEAMFGFAYDTTLMMERLAHGLGGTTETLEEHRDEMANSARAFWGPWAL